MARLNVWSPTVNPLWGRDEEGYSEDPKSRLTLTPGETARVSFEVPSAAPEFWDMAQGCRRLERGPYDLLLGASSEDIRLRSWTGRGRRATR